MIYYRCSKGNETKANKKKFLKPLDKQKNLWYNKYTVNERFTGKERKLKL